MSRKWIVRTTKGSATAHIVGTLDTLELVAPAPNNERWLVEESPSGIVPLRMWHGYMRVRNPEFPEVLGRWACHYTLGNPDDTDVYSAENREAVLAAAPPMDNDAYVAACRMQARFDRMSWRELLAAPDAELVVTKSDLQVLVAGDNAYCRKLPESTKDVLTFGFDFACQCVATLDGRTYTLCFDEWPAMPNWLRKVFWPGTPDDEDETTAADYMELWANVGMNYCTWWVLPAGDTVTLMMCDGLSYTLPPGTVWPATWPEQKQLLTETIKARTLTITWRK